VRGRFRCGGIFDDPMGEGLIVGGGSGLEEGMLGVDYRVEKEDLGKIVLLGFFWFVSDRGTEGQCE